MGDADIDIIEARIAELKAGCPAASDWRSLNETLSRCLSLKTAGKLDKALVALTELTDMIKIGAQSGRTWEEITKLIMLKSRLEAGARKIPARDAARVSDRRGSETVQCLIEQRARRRG